MIFILHHHIHYNLFFIVHHHLFFIWHHHVFYRTPSWF
jgi:hypothetical protein